MADLSTLPLPIRSTIAESLADLQENFENAAEASEGDAAAFFTERALQIDTVQEFFLHGRDMTDEDISLIREALDASVENCTELGLDGAAAGYQDALDAL